MIDSPFRKAMPVAALESPVPPPQYVRYVPKGEIRSAWRSPIAPFSSPRPRNFAKRQGLLYQRRIEAWARGLGLGDVEAGPWFAYLDDSSIRHYCQPDLLIHNGRKLFVVETKFRWTTDAWWQLQKIYVPVLRLVFPNSSLYSVCVCKSFDPAIVAPERVEIRENLASLDPAILNVLLVT